MSIIRRIVMATLSVANLPKVHDQTLTEPVEPRNPDTVDRPAPSLGRRVGFARAKERVVGRVETKHATPTKRYRRVGGTMCKVTGIAISMTVGYTLLAAQANAATFSSIASAQAASVTQAGSATVMTTGIAVANNPGTVSSVTNGNFVAFTAVQNVVTGASMVQTAIANDTGVGAACSGLVGTDGQSDIHKFGQNNNGLCVVGATRSMAISLIDRAITGTGNAFILATQLEGECKSDPSSASGASFLAGAKLIMGHGTYPLPNAPPPNFDILHSGLITNAIDLAELQGSYSEFMLNKQVAGPGAVQVTALSAVSGLTITNVSRASLGFAQCGPARQSPTVQDVTLNETVTPGPPITVPYAGLLDRGTTGTGLRFFIDSCNNGVVAPDNAGNQLTVDRSVPADATCPFHAINSAGLASLEAHLFVHVVAAPPPPAPTVKDQTLAEPVDPGHSAVVDYAGLLDQGATGTGNTYSIDSCSPTGTVSFRNSTHQLTVDQNTATTITCQFHATDGMSTNSNTATLTVIVTDVAGVPAVTPAGFALAGGTALLVLIGWLAIRRRDRDAA